MQNDCHTYQLTDLSVEMTIHLKVTVPTVVKVTKWSLLSNTYESAVYVWRCILFPNANLGILEDLRYKMAVIYA